MKILFFLNILRSGAGMINREMSFAKELNEKKYEVSILSYFKPTLSMGDDIKVANIIPTPYIQRIYNSPLLLPFIWLKIFWTLCRIKPEIVMVDLPGEAQWAYRFRSLFKYKVVFTYHGVADAKFYKGKTAEFLIKLKQFGHDMLKQADKVLVVSDFLRQEVTDIGVDSVTIYNGFDASHFNKENTATRQNKKLLFIGRFTEYKGALNIVKAFAQAYKDTPEAQLEMYGYFESQEYVDKIKGFIQKHQLQNSIALLGPLPPSFTARKMKECGIFINGSVDETFCMPILEAQACGTPCIAFKAAGIPEVVDDGETGLLAKANDIHDMAEKIKRLLNDEKFYLHCSRNTHSHTHKFNYKNLVNKLISQLDEIYPKHKGVTS